MSDLALVLAAVAVALLLLFLLQRPRPVDATEPEVSDESRKPSTSPKGKAKSATKSKKKKKKRRKKKAKGKSSSSSSSAAEESQSESATGGSAEGSGLARIRVEEDEELELTKLTLPSLDEPTVDDTEEWSRSDKQAVIPIIYDEEAAVDEPTGTNAFILVSAVGQTDRGRRRKRNEDRLLVLDVPPVFAVADGMGGYAGGEVASTLATEAVAEALKSGTCSEPLHKGIPRRGSELVNAIQAANEAIFERAKSEPEHSEMGTTLVCARFSPNKQRVYIGHVGDSRCYLVREGEIHQVTSDHTAGMEHHVTGPLAKTLTRALGITRGVVVDLILGKPHPGDRYLLCSDGLTKMVTDEQILEVVSRESDPEGAVSALIDAANAAGGKDNVTVIVIRVDPA